MVTVAWKFIAEIRDRSGAERGRLDSGAPFAPGTISVVDELAARCRALCPGFVATGPMIRGRKSELLRGEVAGSSVIAKRLREPSPVWAWYTAREIALYRTFATDPIPVRTPRLVAASDDVLVIERIAGTPLATVRRPYAALSDEVLDALLATLAALERADLALPAIAAPSRVRAQLRDRLLEDPVDPGWIADGLARCARRGLVPAEIAVDARATLAGVPIVVAHGDALLRNAIADASSVTLVDWECAGRYLRDWDRALLWTQLDDAGRARVEHAIGDDRSRVAPFRALVVFALARELRFARAFAGGAAVAERVRDDLARAVARC